MKQIIPYTFFLVLLLCGCSDQGTLRHYSEITIESTEADPHAHLEMPRGALPITQQAADPQTKKMLEDSKAQVPLLWSAPEGWSELPGSGMRLVTFNSKGSDPVTVTIVSLGGMAGGLQENVVRWIGQIGLEPDQSQLTEFLASIDIQYSGSGLPYEFVDLALLQGSEESEAGSIKAGLMHVKGATIFIKMTGSYSAVNEHHDALLRLINSISINHE